MKLVVLSLISISAFATQVITCYEITKTGKRAEKGGTLRIEYDSQAKRDDKASIKMTGIWKKGSEYGKEFSFLSADESKEDAEVTFTHFNFNDSGNGEWVEYQLQFEERVLNQNFKGKKATLVVGFDAPNEEGASSWGRDMKCSSKVD